MATAVEEESPLLHPKDARTGHWARLKDYVTENVKHAPVLMLLVVVIALGSTNRVLYKIQLTPMANYPLFLGWFITIAYCLLYWTILAIRRYLGIITPKMLEYPKMKFVLMGICDAAGYVMGIFAATKLSGFLLTLLPQLIIPITMVVTVVLLRSTYSIWQARALKIRSDVLGAAIIVGGEVVSIIPTFAGGTSGNLLWIGFYVLSILPSALSFVLKESVFTEVPLMDIFVVNSMDSAFQLIFTLLSLPIVLIPGFGGIPFQELPSYVTHAGYCFVGISPTPADDCTGEPYVSLLYMVINLSWNISMLLLVKRGGAVLTFIGSAVSVPIAHLAFAISWPLLPASRLYWEDAIALVLILGGLIFYRVATLMKARAAAPTPSEKMPFVAVNSDTPATDEKGPKIESKKF